MDKITKYITRESRIRLTVVDVTMTSKALEARHLSGPVAAAVLAEALASVALLSADASQAEEAWMLRMNVTGDIGGLLVEASQEGCLRGFTNRKTLDALDGLSPINTAAALGDSGSVQIVSTVPGRILNQAVLQVNPPHLRYVLGRFFNHSQQIPTGCNVWVEADDGGLLSARALLLQRMEDSDQAVFVRSLERLEAGMLDAFMLQRVWPQDPGESIRAALECDVLQAGEERILSFGCRCSKDKVLGILAALSLDELDEMIVAGRSQDVTCHMCGQTYAADTDDLKKVHEAIAAKNP